MPDAALDKIAEAVERIAKLMAGDLLKEIDGEKQHVKISRLKGCGFKNTEIADMLGTTPNVVNVAVHGLRKKRRGKKTK